MLMRNDRKFRDCSALYVIGFKIDMATMYFWPSIRFFASHALKDDLTQLGKNSSHFTLQMKYLVSLLWKLLHRFKLFKLKLSLDDETKDYVDRNTGGQVNSLHEVTELG